MTPKYDKDMIRKKMQIKIPHNIGTKILKQNTANSIQRYIKMIKHMIKWDLAKESKVGLRPENQST